MWAEISARAEISYAIITLGDKTDMVQISSA